MNINELKQNRIVAGAQTMPAVVITLTAGAAAYCIYKGVEQAVKKTDEKSSTKNVGSREVFGLEKSLFSSSDDCLRRVLEFSISDVCFKM